MDENTGEYGGGEPGAPTKWDFSVKVAKDWEAAFFSTPTPATRQVAMRTAILLNADEGSIFAVLSRLVRLGLGGANGSGNQFVSWIHQLDFLRAIGWLITHHEFSGVVNLASPNPPPNYDFMRALRQAWRQPIGLPATEWMIAIGTALLRTEPELVLKSRRVVPGRLLDTGFQFSFPLWPAAAQDLVHQWRLAHSSNPRPVN